MELKKVIAELDKSDMLAAIKGFPGQIEHARELAEGFSLPEEYSKAKAVVVSGMGGSAIGGDIVRALTADECRVPMIVNRNYTLPGWVGKDTLALFGSYSGNTEETLSAYEEAKNRGCMIACVTSGGELAKRAEADSRPSLRIPEGFQPRAALGYGFVPVLHMMSTLGFIDDKEAELNEGLNLLRVSVERFSTQSDNNLALDIAEKIYGKLVIIYTPEANFGVVATRWKNQIQENGKTLAYSNGLPEMNHNEIMGWHLNGLNEAPLVPLFLTAPGVYDRVERRISVTRSIIEGSGVDCLTITADGESRLAQMLYLVNLGDFVSYYLAMLGGVDPTPVDKIASLKKELAL